MNPTFGEYFFGIIDNVFVFSGALTDAQIANIRAGGSNGAQGEKGPPLKDVFYFMGATWYKAILSTSPKGGRLPPLALLLLND